MMVSRKSSTSIIVCRKQFKQKAPNLKKKKKNYMNEPAK